MPPFGYNPNLYELGLRHIPPYGFLPLDEPTAWLDNTYYGQTSASDQDIGALSERDEKIVELARERAQQYFAGTNVITLPKVALHDDDIFEDIRDAQDKDPIELRDFQVAWWECLGRGNGWQLPDEDQRTAKPLGHLLADEDYPRRKHLLVGILLYRLLRPRAETGLTLERLVNREIDVVELIIPMEGLRRRLEAPTSRPRKRRGPEADAVLDYFRQRGLLDEATPGAREFAEDYVGASARPRPFAFYVKRRLTLWEVFYRLLDALLDELQLVTVALAPVDQINGNARDIATGEETTARAAHSLQVSEGGLYESIAMLRGESRASHVGSTAELRQSAESDVPSELTVLEGVARSPTILEGLATAVRTRHPAMQLDGPLMRFEERLHQLTDENDEPDTRVRQRAAERAIDDAAVVHPGFAGHRLVAALAPDRLDDYHKSLRARALGPEEVRRHPVHRQTIIDATLFPEGYRDIWEDDGPRETFEVLRRHLSERSVGDFVEQTSAKEVFVGWALGRDRAALAERVGEKIASQFVDRLQKIGPSLVRAVGTVGRTEKADLEEVNARFEKSGTSEVFDHLLEENKELAGALRSIYDVLGEQRFRSFFDDLV